MSDVIHLNWKKIRLNNGFFSVDRHTVKYAE